MSDTLEGLKRTGDAPEWMGDEGYRTLLGGYLLPGETPRQMYSRVAAAAASHYADSGRWGQKFFDAMWSNWLCAASPVLSNMGTTRGLPISCNSLHLGDSVHSIFTKNLELAMLSKNGAGVGIYLGDVRGRGASIKGNGKSEGVIPWAKIYDTTTVAVSQGSTRRGASALYLPIDHPDIDEFINIRRPTGDVNRRCLNTNHGVCISDDWMQKLVAGDESKRRLWAELLKARVEMGEPYFMFTDAANRANPACYKQNNLSVKTSNICCLAAGTEVLTREGPRRIEDLTGETVEVFDGKQWVATDTFQKRGEDCLLRIHLSNGTFVDCNPTHRWFVADSSGDNELEGYREITADKLERGHCLEFGKGRGLAWYLCQVTKTESLGKQKVPVYCPHIPSTGKFLLANGLMTGNSEIFLHTDEEHSFVCCLSSLNLVRWDEWRNTDLVATAVRFLDGVIEEYIQKAAGLAGLEASLRSAIKGRAIGIGVLGWHTLLQERMIPFDSFDAMRLNGEVFKTIREAAEAETAVIADELGEPEWCRGFGRRNTHLMAVAPTVSNSTISGGYSAGIEPISANIFSQKSAKGTFIRRNGTLEQALERLGRNTPEVWKSINEYAGSVQHLDFLDDQHKQVFQTAREINQHAIVRQAGQRQRYIDQGQSVNLFFASNSSPQYIHDVHLAAWELGLKSLYYLRTEGVIRGDLASRSRDECLACEG